MTLKATAFPNGISQPVRELFEKYMHLSNAHSAHTDHEKGEQHCSLGHFAQNLQAMIDEQAFVELFTEDGIYQFADKVNKGQKAIYDFRHALFANIPHRDHYIIELFTRGDDDSELMALGGVKYKHHDGTDDETNWAARYSIEKADDGTARFKLIQIILNPAHDDEK